MKIIENSARRLELRFAGSLQGGQCVLDRNAGEAEITHLVFGVPWNRKRISLAQISNVTVKRPNDRKTYFATLQLTSGDDLRLAGSSKEDAMEAARAVRDFLKAKPGPA